MRNPKRMFCFSLCFWLYKTARMCFCGKQFRIVPNRVVENTSFWHSRRPLCHRFTGVLASARATPRWWSSAVCCSIQSTELWTETFPTSPLACWKISTRYKWMAQQTLWHWVGTDVMAWSTDVNHGHVCQKKGRIYVHGQKKHTNEFVNMYQLRLMSAEIMVLKQCFDRAPQDQVIKQDPS